MVSKIIELERKRQEELFSIPLANLVVAAKQFHKQSLINLKEYMEERSNHTDWLLNEEHMDAEDCFPLWGKIQIRDKQKELKEDIKELNEMIKRYGK